MDTVQQVAHNALLVLSLLIPEKLLAVHAHLVLTALLVL
jgi:hypothetical protein